MDNIEKFIPIEASSEENYKNLSIGDIILAKRYQTEEEKNNIPLGHREGPYVVIGKNSDKLICLYISGNPPSNKFFLNKILELNNHNYFLDKNSYIYITKQAYITLDRFIKKIDYLTEEDQINLLKKYEIIKRNKKNDELNIPYYELDSGDIINKENDLYLIISVTNDNYQCIKMCKEKIGLDFYIKVDNKKYYLDFDNIVNYSKTLYPIRKKFITNQILLNILEMQKQRLNYLKQKSNVCRGSLIKIDKTYYYIYGELGNEWLAFSITNKSIDYEELCQIEIGKNKYYTDFSRELKIPKNNNNLELIDLATELQIEKIKNEKKSYIKNIQKENKKTSRKQQKIIKKEITSGSIVKIINADKSHPFIVLTRDRDKLITIMYDKYLEGKYYFQIFYIDQVENINNIDNYELKQILYNIKDLSKHSPYISKSKIKELINELKTN